MTRFDWILIRQIILFSRHITCIKCIHLFFPFFLLALTLSFHLTIRQMAPPSRCPVQSPSQTSKHSGVFVLIICICGKTYFAGVVNYVTPATLVSQCYVIPRPFFCVVIFENGLTLKQTGRRRAHAASIARVKPKCVDSLCHVGRTSSRANRT